MQVNDPAPIEWWQPGKSQATTEDEEIPAVTIEAERKPNSSNRESRSALLELHFGFLHSSAYITITAE